jgi:single-stranded-DNA-specific exonuclease
MHKSARDIFTDNARTVAAHFSALKPIEIVVLHHNDADGISSGAILYGALCREGYRPRRIALEKPFPQALEVIFRSFDAPQNAALFLVDFGSGMLPWIEQAAPKDLSVFVLDHHQIAEVESARISILNPLTAGIAGGRDCTASTVSYLFAEALNLWNLDQASNAVVGIVGDGQFPFVGDSQSPNQRVYQQACTQGLLVTEGDTLRLKGLRDFFDLDAVVRTINAMGSIGYFEGGVDLAVKGLVDGWGPEVEIRGAEYSQRFIELCERVKNEVVLHNRGNLTWFELPDGFGRYGVKTVGLLCEYLVAEGLVAGDCYVLGSQSMPSLRLGFEEVVFSEKKISMRVGLERSQMIARGMSPDLTSVLPLAAKALSGFVDGCHPLAAAVTIPSYRLAEMINEVSERIHHTRSTAE